MPRPEGKLDSEAGEAQRFAAELRELRRKAGAPTYAAMATRTHYSKATLASAASGHRLPTLGVALAYVAACNGDVESWRARWHEAAALLDQAVEIQKPQSGFENPDNLSVQGSDLRVKGWHGYPNGSRSRVIAIASAILVATTLIITVGIPRLGARHRNVIATRPPSTVSELKLHVSDNADPRGSTCASDPGLTSLDAVDVVSPGNHFLGLLELRFAPMCSAAWGRFTPSPRLTRLGVSSSVTLTAVRPSTDTVGTTYRTPLDGQAAFGNLMTTQAACVVIRITVTASDGDGGSATTRCRG